jgi:hypothetical protein
MNKKIVTILLTAGILFLYSCQKNSDIFVPDSGQINAPDTPGTALLQLQCRYLLYKPIYWPNL